MAKPSGNGQGRRPAFSGADAAARGESGWRNEGGKRSSGRRRKRRGKRDTGQGESAAASSAVSGKRTVGNRKPGPKRQSAPAPKRDEQSAALARPVFFVGFMGAGKTSVSRYMARRWKFSAIDLDVYLERREGRVIRDIFAEDGEAAFRAIETDVLREVGESPNPSLVSCGGGIVERPENRELLERLGTVVHLRVSADEAAGRISNKSTRPLFNDIEGARALCERRAPLYDAAADVVVDTAGKSVAQIAYEVMRALRRRGDVRPLPKKELAAAGDGRSAAEADGAKRPSDSSANAPQSEKLNNQS